MQQKGRRPCCSIRQQRNMAAQWGIKERELLGGGALGTDIGSWPCVQPKLGRQIHRPGAQKVMATGRDSGRVLRPGVGPSVLPSYWVLAA